MTNESSVQSLSPHERGDLRVPAVSTAPDVASLIRPAIFLVLRQRARASPLPLPPRSEAERWGGVRGGGLAPREHSRTQQNARPPTPDPSPPFASRMGGGE